MATAAQRAELQQLIKSQFEELPVELHDASLWSKVVETQEYELLQKEQLASAAELWHTETFLETVSLLLEGYSLEEVAQHVGWESIDWMKKRMVYIAKRTRAKKSRAKRH